MNKFVQFLLIAHPAGGVVQKRNAGQEKKENKPQQILLSPESFHSRNSASKRENPRFNPAP